ncbi:MAG: thioredoxin domain-containing protein, partial [Candidatus Levyibacteriota bacterium]
MRSEAKILLGVGAVTVAILAGAVFLLSGRSTPVNTTAEPQILVRSDSNKIGSESAKITLVEFGDFQCPACAASYPIVREIKAVYKDELQFVFRNFPLPTHGNAFAAAVAAEAAGAQG